MEDASLRPCNVEAILFDFGGVLAEEGFRDGLSAIAALNGLEPGTFVRTGFELVYETGYVTGRVDESFFWGALRSKTGIDGSDESLRHEILSHFRLRPPMIALVKGLKEWIEYTGKDHLHHRLVALGLSEPQAVLFIYLIAACLGMSGINLRATGDIVIYLEILQGLVIFAIIVILMRTGRKLVKK